MQAVVSVSVGRDREFLKLWAGQTISEIGSRITREGLPLTAVLVLGATPVQMGFLALLGRCCRWARLSEPFLAGALGIPATLWISVSGLLLSCLWLLPLRRAATG